MTEDAPEQAPSEATAAESELEPATSAPEAEQAAETAEGVGETSAPEPEEQIVASEDQQGDAADDAPREEAQPGSEPTDEAQIPTDSHATDFAKPNRTPSPSPDEKQSIEKPELLPIPEQSANTTADPSRLNTEELEADTRKRKRRSATPELSMQDVRAKKPKSSENDVREAASATDDDIVMDQRAPEEAEKELDEQAMEVETINDAQKTEPESANTDADNTTSQADPDPSLRANHENKDRYRDAFKPASSTVTDTPADTQDDRAIAPAMHPATPALYIRNFMRPLRPEQLQSHLVALASPPNADPDPAIVSALFLDSIKTHALVRFASIAAASRVRASLHDTVWPPEGNRKALWVDFVPDAECAAWITEEEDAVAAEKEARAAGRSIASKKFEVVYTPTDDGAYTAVFQELGTGTTSTPSFNPPTGPRRPSHFAPDTAPHPSASDVPQATRRTAEQSFKTLDELFCSTVAKPKLYFLPVSDERAEVRARELQMETSRDWVPEERRKGRGMQNSGLDQKARYAFDGEDRVVDVGGDFGPWSEGTGGGRGGRGGRGGGYRGRGRGRGAGGWRSGNVGGYGGEY